MLCIYFLILLFCILVEPINSSSNVAIKDFQITDKIQSIPVPKINLNGESFSKEFIYYWNPQQVYDNYEWNCLCENNPDGDYQNPRNCNQFIMCSGGRVFVAECPADGSFYPIEDSCLYHGSPGAQCPWRSMWLAEPEPDCQTIGERPYWSSLTLPVNPKERCGAEIRLCSKSEEIWRGLCPNETRYSKAYNGCLPEELCEDLAEEFQL